MQCSNMASTAVGEVVMPQLAGYFGHKVLQIIHLLVLERPTERDDCPDIQHGLRSQYSCNLLLPL